MFPPHDVDAAGVARYLQALWEFLTVMRELIEQERLYRIAFHTCPQIHRIQ